MKLDEEFIKSLPVTTNKISVTVDWDVFFEKYSIVSYYGTSKEDKNLSYESLCKTPALSVVGVWAKWPDRDHPFVRFFILVPSSSWQEVREGLRQYDYIVAKRDTLEDYPSALKERIVASLAINSLGQAGSSNRIYSNGALFVCDDTNFTVKSKYENVCLRIEVNVYNNLLAHTTTFSHPTEKDLKNPKVPVFKVTADVSGTVWNGQGIQPYVPDASSSNSVDLDSLYIKKKLFKNDHNVVPWWPLNKEEYIHGKLFAVWQVVDAVNDRYAGVVSIDFCDHDVWFYDEYKTDKHTGNMLASYFAGKTFYIDDPFKTEFSRERVGMCKDSVGLYLGGKVSFTRKPAPFDLIIRFCEPPKEDKSGTYYTQSVSRLSTPNNAVQHIVADRDRSFFYKRKADPESSAAVRRILIELLVKDSLIRGRMPVELAEHSCGWNFYRYKINQGRLYGASLSVSGDGEIRVQNYGFSQYQMGEDYETFVRDVLKFGPTEKIKGRRDYMAMERKGNVYLIIDTDEVPILDAHLIDEGYSRIENEGQPLSMFRRKRDNSNHLYLRGYIGLHVWKSEPIEGEAEPSYSYISGCNTESFNTQYGEKVDRMPRVRKIFVLHKENPDIVESDIMDVCLMLKFGFGRWGKMMTYPFPFKFLHEHLDNLCELHFLKHWRDFTYKKDL